MPTLLDTIKDVDSKSLTCLSIHDHINSCQVCGQLYTQKKSSTSTMIIIAILIIFVGVFIYQKFI